MLVIIKNDWKRLLEEKSYLFVSILLTICAVVAAIVLTNEIEIKGNIAVVSRSATVEFTDCKYLNITVLDVAPPKSELVQNRYDAVVTIDNGEYTVDTIKSDEFKEMIYEALSSVETFASSTGAQRKIGTNIIGYMMMFLLMQGVLYARLFAEDKEKRMIERVAMSPIAFTKYMLGHAIFMSEMIFLPSFGVIAVAKFAGATIGFSLMQYIGLIAVLTILSIAFALFLNSLFCVMDTTNMIGSSIIVLSSILAGSFNSFANKETLFDKLLNVIPQKDFINFVDAMEKGTISINSKLQLIYVIGLSAFLFIFAIVKTRRDYIYHQ